MAGARAPTAETLDRALEGAVAERVPSNVIVASSGFMGHAQQASGLLATAKRTFEGLRAAPNEGVHALVHLGRIASIDQSVEATLDFWMSHPDGLQAVTALVVTEADTLWRAQPDRSYRLVGQALRRIDRATGRFPTASVETARARLMARARENAM
jgi:hypothetical protein